MFVKVGKETHGNNDEGIEGLGDKPEVSESLPAAEDSSTSSTSTKSVLKKVIESSSEDSSEDEGSLGLEGS